MSGGVWRRVRVRPLEGDVEDCWMCKFQANPPDQNYAFTVYNPLSNSMWTETLAMPHQQILERFKSWNSFNDDLSVEEILDLMTQAFDKPDLVLKAGPMEARGGDSVRTFTLETNIRTTAVLKWTHTAQKALDSEALKGFWGEILQILALNRQLTSEIEAKDEELKDHVEGGSVLTRKSLKTPKFDLETSCKKAMAAQGSDGDPLDLIEESSEVIARLTSAKKELATSLDKKKSPAKRSAGEGEVGGKASPQKPSIASKLVKANPVINPSNGAAKKPKPRFL